MPSKRHPNARTTTQARASAHARWNPPPGTLDELEAAADDHERLAYAAHAALVKRDILVRRARREGASLRAISERIRVSKDTVNRICLRPEPELHRRPKVMARRQVGR